MGKTRLAQERDALPQSTGLAGGVWFVDLAGCVSGVDILHKVADTKSRFRRAPNSPVRHAIKWAMTHRGQFIGSITLNKLYRSLKTRLGHGLLWPQMCSSGHIASITGDGEVVDVPPLSTEDAVALFVERAKAVKPSFLFVRNTGRF